MRAGAYTLHRHECMALSNDSQWMMSSPRGRERGTVGGWPGSGIIPCRARADQAKKKRMRLLRRGVGHRSEPRQRQPQPAVGEPAIAGPGSPLPTWPDGRWAMGDGVAARRCPDRAPPAARGPCSSAWEDVGPSLRSCSSRHQTSAACSRRPTRALTQSTVAKQKGAVSRPASTGGTERARSLH